jgi:hypothetical protein
MGRRRPVVILLLDGREDLVFTPALIRVASTIYAAYRQGGSLATLIGVAFSAGHSRDTAVRRVECSARLGLELVDQRTRFVCHVE